MTQNMVNYIAYEVVGAAIEVHKQLGPGLLESVYSACLTEELESKGWTVDKEVYVPVLYKNKDLGEVLRLDLLIEDTVIVELKAVATIHPVHKAQLHTYLKLAGKPKGLLINFNCTNITKEGLVPIVTELFAQLPNNNNNIEPFYY